MIQEFVDRFEARKDFLRYRLRWTWSGFGEMSWWHIVGAVVEVVMTNETGITPRDVTEIRNVTKVGGWSADAGTMLFVIGGSHRSDDYYSMILDYGGETGRTCGLYEIIGLNPADTRPTDDLIEQLVAHADYVVRRIRRIEP